MGQTKLTFADKDHSKLYAVRWMEVIRVFPEYVEHYSSGVRILFWRRRAIFPGYFAWTNDPFLRAIAMMTMRKNG